jgi:hypothetical protein
MVGTVQKTLNTPGDKYYAWNPVAAAAGPLWVWLRFHFALATGGLPCYN